MKRVLVTGASGFIGRWSLPGLAARGYEVHATTSRAASPKDTAGVRWHQVDLLNPADARSLVWEVRPTHLLHFAWYTKHRLFWTSPLNVRWIQASVDLLQAFQESDGERAVMAGSCAEYGRCAGDCSESTTGLAPETLYGASKYALQLAAAAMARETGISLAWGRIFFPFGPEEHPDRLVPSVTRALLMGEPARCSHGNQVRDFLEVEDVASAFVALLDSEVTGPVNIGSGVPTRIRDVVDVIGRYLGRAELIRLGALEAPAGEPPRVVADTSRLTGEVGWRPRHTLETGLERTIEWWQDAIGVREARS